MKTQAVRIIAGNFRGRKIHFPSGDSVRPTPDRVKETLFNWLRADILDACCLDLFAGSGALGFEAISRGAKEVVMIDSSKEVIKQLQQTSQELKLTNVEMIYSVFPSISLSKKFDIVFLDPPFHKNLVQLALDYLINRQLLNASALVYAETERTVMLKIPEQFEILKESIAGDVRFQLLRASDNPIEKLS